MGLPPEVLLWAGSPSETYFCAVTWDQSARERRASSASHVVSWDTRFRPPAFGAWRGLP